MMAQRMFYPDLQCTFLKCIRGPASNFYVGTEDMMIDLLVKPVVRILKTRDPTKNKKCALLPEHCRKLTGKASHLSGIPCLKQAPSNEAREETLKQMRNVLARLYELTKTNRFVSNTGEQSKN